MKKILILIAVVSLSVFLAGCKKKNDFNTSGETSVASNHILFWGNGCSHCEKVDEFLEGTGLQEKLNISKMEVFSNKDGAKVYLEKAKECGENTSQISVPMMFWEGECISGDTPIIDKLNKES